MFGVSSGVRYIFAVLALALGVASLTGPAEANRRCGYDRYGYHAPSWRGCDRLRYDWDGYPPPPPVQIYRPYPVYRAYPKLPPAVYAAPVYGYGYRGGRCHYDNGWYGVIVVCE